MYKKCTCIESLQAFHGVLSNCQKSFFSSLNDTWSSRSLSPNLLCFRIFSVLCINLCFLRISSFLNVGDFIIEMFCFVQPAREESDLRGQLYRINMRDGPKGFPSVKHSLFYILRLWTRFVCKFQRVQSFDNIQATLPILIFVQLLDLFTVRSFGACWIGPIRAVLAPLNISR